MSKKSESKFHTVWKFQDFSIGVKSVILTLLEALKFHFYEFLHFYKTEICQINKILSPEYCINSSFTGSRFFKIHFTQNLCDRKNYGAFTICKISRKKFCLTAFCNVRVNLKRLRVTTLNNTYIVEMWHSP